MAEKKKDNKAFIYIGLGVLGLAVLIPKKSKGEYPNLHKYLDNSDVTKSRVATEENISQQFVPPEQVYINADYFAKKVLNPIIKHFGRENIEVDSWYRSKALNEHPRVGGSDTSFHLSAFAGDLDYIKDGVVRNDLLLKFIVDKKIPFTELAVEHGTVARPKTVHIALVPDRFKYEVLRITNSGTVRHSLTWLKGNYN